ncbi:hypothetical protein TNCV_458471 [Trichonephila clavipes]|nr:hypothetical protein TNCV_458471 [Trichonephila clavipes]
MAQKDVFEFVQSVKNNIDADFNDEDEMRNRDYTGMWVRRGSTNLMAGKVVFLRRLLSPIRVVDLTVMNPLRNLFEVVRSALKSTYMPFLEAFFPLTSARKTSRQESELAARGNPPSTLFLSDKYHPCKF